MIFLHSFGWGRLSMADSNSKAIGVSRVKGVSVSDKTKGIWIPIEIWDLDDLTLHEKLFLVKIIGLDNKDGCWANNRHFADFFKVSRQRSSQIITSLEKKEYITICKTVVS